MIQDDGRLLDAYMRRVKGVEPKPGGLLIAVDQSGTSSSSSSSPSSPAPESRSGSGADQAPKRGGCLAAPQASTVDRPGSSVALVAVAIGGAAYATHAPRSQDLTTVDTRFSIRGTQTRPDDIVMVGSRRPDVPRASTTVAVPAAPPRRVIDRLREAGARAIAYDVQFSETPTRETTKR